MVLAIRASGMGEWVSDLVVSAWRLERQAHGTSPLKRTLRIVTPGWLMTGWLECRADDQLKCGLLNR
jgi:hypothetical protein